MGQVDSYAEDHVSKVATFFIASENGSAMLLASTHGRVHVINDEAIKRVLSPYSIVKVAFDLIEDKKITLVIINPPQD